MNKERLKNGLEKMGIAADETALDRFEAFHAILDEYNARMDLTAVLDQPVAHHVALCARFVAALRAADNHQHRLLLIFLQRRRQPSFQRDGGRAIRLNLRAEHNDGVKIADRGQMRLLVIDKADQPRRTNHAKENKRCKHRQQPP